MKRLCAATLAAAILFALPSLAGPATDVTTIIAARAAVGRGHWKAAIAPLTALVAQSSRPDAELKLHLKAPLAWPLLDNKGQAQHGPFFT